MTDQINRLLSIMKQLRDPQNGCEWDRVQNFASIAPYTIEEAYEVADAIARGSMEELREELGDLLFQTVFHAQMADEDGLFDFNDVAKAISDKMVARHPHIFGENAQDTVSGWENIKAKERKDKGSDSAMDGVALALPELMRAAKLQKRAARTGFDWDDMSGPRDKLLEELDELDQAVGEDELLDEAGDVIFSLVNIIRRHGVDPEQALRSANAKFERRFRTMEQIAQSENSNFDGLSLEEKEALWQKVKAGEISAE